MNTLRSLELERERADALRKAVEKAFEQLINLNLGKAKETLRGASVDDDEKFINRALKKEEE